MNNKGQQMGTILVVFIAILVGVILFQTIAQQVGTSTTATGSVNSSETLATNGNSIYIEEYKALYGVTVRNVTGNVLIGAGNYTVTNNVVHNGALTVQVKTNSAQFGGYPVYVLATSGEVPTYISSSGGRAMASLIVIFFALAVGMIALYPTLKEGMASFR